MTNNNKTEYRLIVLGSLVGFVASFWQLIEKLTLLKNSQAVLPCNLNAVFSCSNVLNAWQSSVFGFPNSLLCIILFTVAFTAAIIGLSGAKITRNIRFGLQFISLFTVFFGLWYLSQSILRLNAICIFCVFCFGGVLAVNAGWFRINYKDYPVSQKTKQQLDTLVARGGDIFVWCLIGLAVVAMALLKFS